MNQIEQHANPEVAKALIATKCDLKNTKVSKDTAEAFASEYGMVFIETSSLTGMNVQEAFQGVTKEVITKQNVQLKKVGGESNAGSRSGSLQSASFQKDLGEGGKKKKCC